MSFIESNFINEEYEKIKNRTVAAKEYFAKNPNLEQDNNLKYIRLKKLQRELELRLNYLENAKKTIEFVQKNSTNSNTAIKTCKAMYEDVIGSKYCSEEEAPVYKMLVKRFQREFPRWDNVIHNSFSNIQKAIDKTYSLTLYWNILCKSIEEIAKYFFWIRNQYNPVPNCDDSYIKHLDSAKDSKKNEDIVLAEKNAAIAAMGIYDKDSDSTENNVADHSECNTEFETVLSENITNQDMYNQIQNFNRDTEKRNGTAKENDSEIISDDEDLDDEEDEYVNEHELINMLRNSPKVQL